MNKGYKNDQICPCVFIKQTKNRFFIIAVYVDDLNIIRTPNEIEETANCMMKEFEMKDLERTKFYVGLQIEYLKVGILVHQSSYAEKILKKFFMDKAQPLGSPMIVLSLKINEDLFHPREEGEVSVWS